MAEISQKMYTSMSAVREGRTFLELLIRPSSFAICTFFFCCMFSMFSYGRETQLSIRLNDH